MKARAQDIEGSHELMVDLNGFPRNFEQLAVLLVWRSICRVESTCIPI